jgi:DNA-binding MarR family transcriptional regulator
MIHVVGINYALAIIQIVPTMPEMRYTRRVMSSTENRGCAASTMFLLPRLAKQVMRRSSPEQLGMDLRLVMALSYLGDHDETPQQELVDALCMDAKNVVLLLNELEDRGYLIRRRDSEDRRRHHVLITPEGREALVRAGHAMEEVENQVLQALDAEERATLWRLLARALHEVEDAADAANAPALTPAAS